jgi:hypothetical protein
MNKPLDESVHGPRWIAVPIDPKEPREAIIAGDAPTGRKSPHLPGLKKLAILSLQRGIAPTSDAPQPGP